MSDELARQSTYNLVVSGGESTVVTEYEPATRRSDAYQSERELEEALIAMLCDQGYERIHINSEEELIANLRQQLEELNDYYFTDKEWNRFFKEKIANTKDTIVEKTRKIQEEFVQDLKRDNGRTQNIKLIDKESIHKNKLQVLNQYENGTKEGAAYDNRYDVTILVNGFPLIHIELKRRGVALKEAFNQINRYQRDSFWAGCGLFEYIQIFVISNGTTTKYYSNTTRDSHIHEMARLNKRQQAQHRTSNSYKFTSFWADSKNKIIPDLVDFTRTFFARHTILSILTHYCVFTAEERLLVMRPYQIAATEQILNRINIATNYKYQGSLDAGGYIWHTTGSGKTLTSFKTAQLASRMLGIDKVLFVVDRKDLDFQTIKEYDRFEKGAADSNANTNVLERQLSDPSSRIIVTTIQKLDRLVSRNVNHEVYKRPIVIIFDECHRSQFGSMHQKIVKKFKNYYIFGFTGTPIFSVNANKGNTPDLKTTEQAFGAQLHSYTIVDAINDENVLPFRIDYVNTVHQKSGTPDSQVTSIDTAQALESPARVKKVVNYILEHFDQKTLRNQYYKHDGKQLCGFNSIFAVSSIPMCIKYYQELKKQIEEKKKDLIIATIFSFAPNGDEQSNDNGLLGDEEFETDHLDQTSRDFLESAIADYNKHFSTNFSTQANGFENYYKDLSQRVKNREVDLLLVVNMFLTGFDATTLNTLWVDKDLKMHGLIQAFSRTNRILNSVKSFGNIVCFRNLEEKTNAAIALFGDKEAGGIVLLKSYDDYYNGYTDSKGKEQLGYKELVHILQSDFPLGQRLVGEQQEKAFIAQFGKLLRLRNILAAFDQFKGHEIISERDFQDYTGIYHDLHEKYVSLVDKKESILDDVVFELELVKQVEVNIDYILELVQKYHAKNNQDKELRSAIDSAIHSSLQLRSKKELIEKFIDHVNTGADIHEDWKAFVQKQCYDDAHALIDEENLTPGKAEQFLTDSLQNGSIRITGTELTKVLPPTNIFDPKSQGQKERVIDKLKRFLDKYFGLIQSIDLLPDGKEADAEVHEYLSAADPETDFRGS